MISDLKLGFRLFFSSKENVMLGLLPLIIGFILYITLGFWGFLLLKDYFQTGVLTHIDFGWGIPVLWTVFVAIVGIIFFFLFNWTFIIFIFFISFPFHKKISQNIEMKLQGKPIVVSKFEFSGLFHELGKIILNLVLTICVFVCATIPVLTWLSVVISALLVSIQLLDYSWSRYNWSFFDCLSDLRNNSGQYLVMGMISLFLFSLPIFNLIMMPAMVSVYTVLWNRLNKTAQIKY